MRWAREVWARAHFDRLCKQLCVETAVDLLCAPKAGIGKGDSIVYVGFNFGVRRPYYGMVHNREPHNNYCRITGELFSAWLMHGD